MNVEQIKNIVEEAIDKSKLFVVEVNCSPSNKITVAVDAFHNITLDECVFISRAIESKLNRDEEDFELEVTSPGLSQPFKVHQQYLKNQGKEVEVLLKDGEKLTGILQNVSSDGIELALFAQKKKSKKPPVEEPEKEFYKFEEIKWTKEHIKF